MKIISEQELQSKLEKGTEKKAVRVRVNECQYSNDVNVILQLCYIDETKQFDEPSNFRFYSNGYADKNKLKGVVLSAPTRFKEDGSLYQCEFSIDCDMFSGSVNLEDVTNIGKGLRWVEKRLKKDVQENCMPGNFADQISRTLTALGIKAIYMAGPWAANSEPAIYTASQWTATNTIVEAIERKLNESSQAA